MSDSLRPHGLYSPWNSPGQNTRVGSRSLLQGIFPTQGSNPGLLHCRWILYQLNHKGSSRILEWVAYPFSSGSSWPRNRTRISCISGRFFTNWAISLLTVLFKHHFSQKPSFNPLDEKKLSSYLLPKQPICSTGASEHLLQTLCFQLLVECSHCMSGSWTEQALGWVYSPMCGSTCHVEIPGLDWLSMKIHVCGCESLHCKWKLNFQINDMNMHMCTELCLLLS